MNANRTDPPRQIQRVPSESMVENIEDIEHSFETSLQSSQPISATIQSVTEGKAT